MVEKDTMISRNSHIHNQKEIEQLKKEIEQLKKQNEKKQRDYEKQVAKNKIKGQKIVAARQAKVQKARKVAERKEAQRIVKAKHLKEVEFKRRQAEASKLLKAQEKATKQEVARIQKEEAEKKAEIAKRKKAKAAEEARQKEDAARKQRLAEYNKKKEEAKKAKLLKVEAAKESKYKKSLQKKKNFSKVKNLKTNVAYFVAAGLLIGSGFMIWKSGLIDIVKTGNDTETYIETAKEASTQEQPQDNSNLESTEEVTQPIDEEEIIVEKHEYIDTDLYNSGYQFDDEITKEFLNSLNPAPSDDTVWLAIPGTDINYPVVHPSVDKIDQVEGLRDWVEQDRAEYQKQGVPTDDYQIMDDYYIKRNIAGEKYAAGTLYLSSYNNKLSQSFDNISDVSVIYGHNMKKDSVYPKMFYALRHYVQNKNYINEHPMAIIYTSDGYGYAVQLVAARIVSSESNSVLHTQNFESVMEKERFVYDFINDAKSQGYTTIDGWDLTSDTKLVEFVTCNGDNKEIVLGVIDSKIKVKDGIVDQSGYYIEEENSYNNNIENYIEGYNVEVIETSTKHR